MVWRCILLQNAFLNAPCCEKTWFEGGKETGDGLGKVCILTCALYGLKSSSTLWRATLAESLRDLNFESTIADFRSMLEDWIKSRTAADGAPNSLFQDRMPSELRLQEVGI